MAKNPSFCDFKKIFSQNIFGWWNVCLARISLNFSTWKELDSDLNAGRWGVQSQLYGKKLKRGTKGPEIEKLVKKLSFYEHYFHPHIFCCGQLFVLVRVTLTFSSWTELNSDLNAGRRAVWVWLYGKIVKGHEKARSGDFWGKSEFLSLLVKFWPKVIIIYIFHNVLYFGHFCASFFRFFHMINLKLPLSFEQIRGMLTK